ncbi:MAG: aldehyde dehydrogenase family protein [Vicinamibacteria bacterium]|nr:aldehyde dehydrogenase family protein [Vicinamibacteria bacterium]
MLDLKACFVDAAGIPAEFQPNFGEVGRTLLIDGRLSQWDGPAADIRSAVWVRDGDRLTPVELGPGAQASAAEARQAIEAASRAFGGGRGDWPRASVAERIACVEAFVRRALPLRERVAGALMWEVGKPYADCLIEFDRTIKYIEATIATLRGMERDAAQPSVMEGYAARIRRAPLGVTLCMGPYNYAVNEVFTIVIPALLMGNPVVAKTPRYGVLANALLASALAESFPRGVVSLISGHGPIVIGPMMESGLVDVLALIGSSKTAAILLRQHPHPYRLRTVLGMGAKNPAIVLEDADLDAAAAEIVSGALTFNGQRCTALKHILVARPAAEALVVRLSDRIAALKIGMPWEKGVVITPMPDPEHPAFLEGLVRDAVTRGAKVINPGGGEWQGTLYRPALVYPVAYDALLASAEQFGPVVPVSVFDTPEQALDIVARATVPRQSQHAVPARAGRFPFHRAQGFRGGDALAL